MAAAGSVDRLLRELAVDREQAVQNSAHAGVAAGHDLDLTPQVFAHLRGDGLALPFGGAVMPVHGGGTGEDADQPSEVGGDSRLEQELRFPNPSWEVIAPLG